MIRIPIGGYGVIFVESEVFFWIFIESTVYDNKCVCGCCVLCDKALACNFSCIPGFPNLC